MLARIKVGLRKFVSNRVVLVLLISLVSFFIINFVVAHSLIGPALNNVFEKTKFRIRGTMPPSSDILIVAIDDQSINYVRDDKKYYYNWPWPRSIYAEAVDRLSANGASVICFDVLFSGDSPESFDRSSEEEDQLFAEAIKRAKDRGTDVILAEASTYQGTTQNLGVQQFWLEGPRDLFIKAGAEVGLVSTIAQEGGYKRREIAITHESGENILSIPLKALLVGAEGASWEKNAPITKQGELDLSRMPVRHAKLSEDYEITTFNINYGGGHQSIYTQSFYSVLDDKLLEIFKDTIKGKIVLIGTESRTLHDEFDTPFGTQYGVETIGHGLDTLINSSYINDLPDTIVFVLALLLALSAGYFALSKRIQIGFFALLILLFVLLMLDFYGFVYLNFSANSVLFYGAILGSFSTSLVYRVIIEEWEKRFIRRTFSRYVSDAVLKEIMEDPSLAEVGGKRCRAALLFSDMRNFSTLSEPLDPQATVDFLNEYLSEMSSVVLEKGGFVDKFMGDGIMAVFGSPLPLENPSFTAVEAALLMIERLKGVDQRLDAKGFDLPDLRIGVGIHVGEVIMGNIGSAKRMEYTVIGDTVNLASRLQDLTKEYREPIVISSEVYSEVKDMAECQYLDEIRVKGRARLEKIYAVKVIADRKDEKAVTQFAPE